jgi:hypothetical protein
MCSAALVSAAKLIDSQFDAIDMILEKSGNFID